MIGIAHNGVHTTLEAVRRCVGTSRVRVVRDDGEPLPYVSVVVGVRALRALRARVENAHTHVVVVDCVENLLRVEHVVLVDAGEHDQLWNPRGIRMHVLRSHITARPAPHPAITFVAHDALEGIIAEACATGMLSAVLALARKLPDTSARTALHLHVVEHLTGKYALSTLRRRTRPERTALHALHDAMCTALGSEAGLALGNAIRMTKNGVDPRSASNRTGADLFEVNYLLAAEENAVVK